MNVATETEPQTLHKRLKAASAAVHDEVDTSVMAAKPFASREAYERFLRFQYHLHRRVEPLYADPALQPVLPDLAQRSRLAALEQDFADLGVTLPTNADLGPSLPREQALGWLYVVEGSNMGAAFLAKEAIKIGLSDEFGARHLAAHPEGRGLNWRRFTAGLDAVELTPEQDAAAQAAAADAFAHVLVLVRQELN